jgi:aspartate aminotransferase-like enzyme
VTARALDEHPEADVVSLVWCETSTGMVNHVPAATAVAAGRGALTFVDAVSAVGAVATDAAAAGVSFLTGVSGKAIAGYPGISFCTYSRAALAGLRAGGLQPRHRYLDLLRNIAHPNGEEFPVTPPTPVLWSLRAALEELLAEGLDRRAVRYARLAAQVRDALAPRGFTTLLDPEAPGNPGLLALRLPSDVDVDDLYAALRRHDVVVRTRPTAMSSTVLLLGTMGTLDEHDVDQLVRAVSDGCVGARHPVASGVSSERATW